MKMRTKRRRGSALITVFIVMLFLGIISAGLMRIIDMNTRSSRQEYISVRARVAAHSVLFALGSVISRDIASHDASPLGLANGQTLTGSFTDRGLTFEIEASRRNAGDYGGRIYTLICRVRQGDEPAVRKQLDIVRRVAQVDPEGDEELGKLTTRWIWGE